MNKRLTLLFAVPALLFAITAACGKPAQGGPGAPGAPGGPGGMGGQRAITVIVQSATNGRLEKYLDISANLAARDEVQVYPDTSGKIASIVKLEGQYVYKGEAIAYVDRFQVGASYALSPVVAPVSGYVTSLYVTKGQNVSQQTPIASIGNINIIDALINIPESSIADIRIGQKIFLTVPAIKDKIFQGTIYRRDYSIDSTTHTMLVRAELDNSTHELLPGMYADVEVFLAAADNAIILPVDCLFKTENGQYAVYVNETNTAVVRIVTIKLETSEYVALASGVNEGDEVVIFGREYLSAGSAIKPIRESENTSDLPTNSMQR